MKDNGMHLVEMELSLIMTDHSILEDGICLEKHKVKIFIEIKSESTIQITGARPVMGRRLTCLEKFSINFCEF